LIESYTEKVQTQLDTIVFIMLGICTHDLLALSISAVTKETVDGLALYVRDQNDAMAIYREAGSPLNSQDLERLKARGVLWLYVDSSAKTEIRERMTEIAYGKVDVPPPIRIAAVAGIVRESMESAMATNEVENICSVTKSLSEITADMICNENFALRDLLPVLSHDYGTFTHTTNVSCYAGVLADTLGCSKVEVEEIVRGALLHDLGKLDIDIEILNKPFRLTDREFRVIKKHPTQGFVRLAQQPNLSLGQLMMVYQHHEKLDGSGYPVGIGEDEIHPWAKLCSVADVYEALTSYRPYRKPMPTDSALSILEQGIGNTFDGEMVSCWTKLTKKNLTKS
jgi:putative nucleotidyltransferase with HDIG domain